MRQFEEILIYIKEFMNEENIFINEPMKNHTTFKVGGEADLLVKPKTYEQLIKVIKACNKFNEKYYIFGKGSNILVKDGGINGVVIKTDNLDNIEFEGNKVKVQSGACLKDVAYACMERGLLGMEFASGIPGTVGGAVTMNAGAYDGEMKNIVESCLLLDENLEILSLSAEELDFEYRKSIIQKKGYIVLETTLALKDGSKDEIRTRIEELTAMRESKQPLEYASAGSTFKRPVGHFTGKLIQDSGLKGCSIGGAQISEKHSGFIINKGGATAADILNLIYHVQKVIKDNYDVALEPEVKIIGEDKMK